MKQAKRMLSVLLALIIMCSMFTVGANALKTSYVKADHYNDILEPVMTTEQVATMLLDMLDTDVLPDLDVNVEITSNLYLNLGSVDKTLDSLKSVDDSTLAAIAMPLLGDIGDLELGCVDGSTRRSSSSVRDMAVLIHVLGVLEESGNPEVIANILDNTFDFGALETFGVLDPATDLAMFDDLHGFVTAMLFDMLYGDGASTAEGTEYSASLTLEEILQDFIDNKLVKMIVDMGADEDDGSNSIAEFLGYTTYAQAGDASDLDEFGCLRTDRPTTELLPSLTPSTVEGDGKLGYLSLTGDSTLDFIWKILTAAIQDLVVPYAGTLIAGMLDEDEAMYVDLIINLLTEVFELDTSALIIPEDATMQEKLDIFLKWFLVGGGISQFLHFEKTFDANGNLESAYLTFADGLGDKMCNLIIVVLPMLPGFWEDAPRIEKTDEELKAMGNEELITYVAQVFLEAFVDGIDFPDESCKTLKELASRTLIEVAAELCPTIDFEQMFEYGQLVYDSDDCLVVGASILQYYLNGHTVMQNSTVMPSFHEILNTAVDWALGEYGGLLAYDATQYTASHITVWDKLYDTVFQIIPIDSFYGVADSAAGVEDFVMNKLLGSILDLDLNRLVSIIGVHPDSGINKSLPDLIIDLLGRVLNPLLGLPFERDYATSGKTAKQMVIPYEYSTLDELITVYNNSSGTLNGTGLKNMVCVLLNNLNQFHKTQNSTLYTIMPLIGQLLGMWNPDNYRFVEDVAPADYPILNIDEFKAIYHEYSEEANDDKSYDDDDYSYFHMVDFKGFLYKEFKSARDDCSNLIKRYNESLTDAEVIAPTRTEMTNAAYYLEKVSELLTTGYNMDGSYEANENDYEHYGETTAVNYQLNKTLNRIKGANYTQVDNGDGTFTYTERTWKAYVKALAFAEKVNNEYFTAANSDDPDRALRDMRQSRINEARKQLIKAAKGLKGWTPLADYSGLDSSIEVVNYIVSMRKYDTEAVQAAVDAYLAAVNLDRDYDVDNQLIVDNRQEALDEAIADLDMYLVDYLELYEDRVSQIVDENTSYIYGLGEGFATPEAIEEMGGLFSDYMMGWFGYGISPEGEYLNLMIEGTANGNGTGSLIKMYSYDDEACENALGTTYSVVIFGDVDGDAYIDGQDAVILRAYNALHFANKKLDGTVIAAADADYSGLINVDDVRLVESSGLKKSTVVQQPDELFAKTYGIVDRANAQ